MAATGLLVRREGGLLRTLPLVPIAAFASLSIVMLWAYDTDATWPANCYAVPYGVRCDPAGDLYLALAGAWIACAGALALLMALEVRRVRRGRSLSLPGLGILGLVVAVMAVGVAWLWAADAASHYRLPHSVEAVLLLTYVTGSLLAFGIAFVDYAPRQGPVRQWATVLAIVNGGLGLMLGVLVVESLLYPPIFA